MKTISLKCMKITYDTSMWHYLFKFLINVFLEIVEK